jgi:DNA-binding NarL/FixJ family response regulator
MPDAPFAENLPYCTILTSIVKRFVQLVGASAAVNVARKIPNLAIDEEGNVLGYDKDNPFRTMALLIDGYETVFGSPAVALSRQATQTLAEATELALARERESLPPRPARRIDVLIVDDHVLFREGLVRLLDPQPDMRVVGQAGSLHEAIALARQLRPAVVLMDISLPDGTGVEATQSILAEQPGTRIMFLTVYDDDEQIFAAIRAGAKGYVLKNVGSTELLDRLRTVARGEAGLSPAMAARVLDEFSRVWAPRQDEPPEAAELTNREVEIVRELARGATNNEIAQRFMITRNTVKNHVRHVLSKLNVSSRREVAQYAREHGLLPPSPHSSN